MDSIELASLSMPRNSAARRDLGCTTSRARCHRHRPSLGEPRVDIGAIGLELRLTSVELGLAGGRLALAGDEPGLGLGNLRFHLLTGGVELT